MEVKIGVVYSPKELTIEMDGKVDEVTKKVEAAMSAKDPVLWLVDKKGRRFGVPTDKVAYVEIGEEDSTKRVGFGSG